MICDRICRNAESLRWSSGKMASLSISRALFSQEELQESKVKTLTDIDGSELKNFAPCGLCTFCILSDSLSKAS